MSTYEDVSIIKRPHESVSYNRIQIEELARCMNPVSGPQYFMENFVWIQHPIRGKEKFSPYEFQYGLIDTYHNYRKSINMVSRQMGKCFSKDTNITIRNKHKEIYDIPVGIFYKYQSAKQNNTQVPDISAFKRCGN